MRNFVVVAQCYRRDCVCVLALVRPRKTKVFFITSQISYDLPAFLRVKVLRPNAAKGAGFQLAFLLKFLNITQNTSSTCCLFTAVL
jgi:hypothetical protein